MNSAVKIDGLTKIYKTRKAVDALTLEIGEGEFFALLGLNGAGKTTTVKMLSCLTPPSSGDALVFGESITKNAEKVKAMLGVSPQETAVAPNLTAAENLRMMAGIYGASAEEADARARRMLEDFGLSSRAKERAKTFSGGQQRRLSIAMALISEPRLLFLDEPTLGLDVRARRELWKHISQLKGRVTVMLTTHYLEEAEALADRIGIIDAGRLVAVGTAGELKEMTGKQTLEDAFLSLAGGDEKDENNETEGADSK